MDGGRGICIQQQRCIYHVQKDVCSAAGGEVDSV